MAAAQSVGGVLGEATWHGRFLNCVNMSSFLLWNGDVSLNGGGMNVPSIVGGNLLFFWGGSMSDSISFLATTIVSESFVPSFCSSSGVPGIARFFHALRPASYVLYLPRASQTTHEHMADFVLIQLDQKSVLHNNSYSLDCPLGYKLDGYNCPLGYGPDCQS